MMPPAAVVASAHAIAVSVLEIAAPDDVEHFRAVLAGGPSGEPRPDTTSALAFGASDCIGVVIGSVVIPFLMALRSEITKGIASEAAKELLRFSKQAPAKKAEPVLPQLSDDLYRECRRRGCTSNEARRAKDALLTVLAAKPELLKTLLS